MNFLGNKSLLVVLQKIASWSANGNFLFFIKALAFSSKPVSLILFKFSVKGYRAFLAEKQKRKKEKEKMRAMYEKGTL